LSATPIPRTLQMALTGIRELSLITTPPIGRITTKISIINFDPETIREVLMKEKARGGQIFYICPRISDLNELESKLATIVPELKTRKVHGQMNPSDLNAMVSDFYEGKFDLLLSTSIVESGLDIPRANTIVVHRADLFGLAQLYQLKGRVGRSNVEAFAYFTVAPNSLTETALKRLQVLQNA
jgi:transcription-repair coupling factor (superfamily II helicase)